MSDGRDRSSIALNLKIEAIGTRCRSILPGAVGDMPPSALAHSLGRQSALRQFKKPTRRLAHLTSIDLGKRNFQEDRSIEKRFGAAAGAMMYWDWEVHYGAEVAVQDRARSRNLAIKQIN